MHGDKKERKKEGGGVGGWVGYKWRHTHTRRQCDEIARLFFLNIRPFTTMKLCPVA